MGQRPRRELVASAIRAELARQGVSPDVLTTALGLSHAEVDALLSGDVALDVDQLEAIGSALEVPIRSLLGEPHDGWNQNRGSTG